MESRAKNASRNIFFGLIMKVYLMLMPFLMRTAMIYLMGIEYVGLNGLFKSVLQVLNLAELGVGSAMVFSMYKPVIESDRTKICALLKLYKIYYRIIGCVVAVIGCILIPFIPKLINGKAPDGINIYVLYLLNLAATVVSYWLFAYKNSLLQAHQRVDIVSKVTIITTTFQYLLQFVVLWILHNYYIYIIVSLVTQAVTNILVAVVASRMYPDYQPEGELDEKEKTKINKKIKDLFTAKFGTIVVGSADTLVISSYLGLKKLAVYQNYYFIVESLFGVILVIFTAIMAGVGNSLVVESKEKNYNDLGKFTFLSCWLITVCTCCLAVVYQPFMKLWVGKKLMLDYSYVIVFCVYFFVMVLAMVWATIKDAAGMWHQDRFRPLVGAIVNLLLNLILVRFIGLYGILLSTVISYVFVSVPWLIYNVFSQIYTRSPRQYVIRLLFYIGVCLVCNVLTVKVCGLFSFEGIYAVILYGFLAVLISCITQLLFYFHLSEFKESKLLVEKMIKKESKNG